MDHWLEEYAAPTVRPSALAGYRQYIDGYIKPRLLCTIPVQSRIAAKTNIGA